GAGGLGERHPGARVELQGVERGCEPLVRIDGNRAVLHHPLTLRELAVDAPVDEEAELGVPEPRASRGTFRWNRVGTLRARPRRRTDGRRGESEGEERETHAE